MGKGQWEEAAGIMKREKTRRDKNWQAQQEGKGRGHGQYIVEANTSSKTEQALKRNKQWKRARCENG